MKWGAVIGITSVFVLITIYEWPKIEPEEKKEKISFAILGAMAWILSLLLLHFPDMPGPSQLIYKIYNPIGKMLEK